MKVYVLYVILPDNYSYDGTYDEVVSIHKTREGAEKAGKDKVSGYVNPSSVSYEIEEMELLQ